MSDEWLPAPDARSKPFFDGARNGKLMMQKCSACHVWHYPVRERCPDCAGTDLQWAPVSGRGTVYSHGQLHRAYHPRHADRLPIIMAVIDLDCGVRMNCNLVDVAATDVRAGMDVEVAFETFPDGATVPVFRPAQR